MSASRVGDHRPQVRVFDAGFVFGQEQIQRLAGFPLPAVHHGFELLARDGAFRQIADAQHVVELQRIAVTGFERGIGAGELFGEVGAVDVVVFALVCRCQTGRVDLMQDAEGFAVHAAVENGFGQIDPCAVDPRAVAVALGQGEHSAGVVVGRVDVVVVVLLVDLLRQGDPFARVFRCGEFVAPRCDAEILRAAVCVAPFDDTVELFERLLMAIGTVGTTRTDAEEQDGEKEREPGFMRLYSTVVFRPGVPRTGREGCRAKIVKKSGLTAVSTVFVAPPPVPGGRSPRRKRRKPSRFPPSGESSPDGRCVRSSGRRPSRGSASAQGSACAVRREWARGSRARRPSSGRGRRPGS